MGAEILFTIPIALGYAVLLTFVGTVLLWLFWILARKYVSSKLFHSRFPLGPIVAALFALSLPFGCVRSWQPVPERESDWKVAAVEVPLFTERDRSEFLTIFRTEALSEGLTPKVTPTRELEERAQYMPDRDETVEAVVYRSVLRRQIEAVVSDQGHPGYAWIEFRQGEDPALARRFRERLMARLVARWPETMSVPFHPRAPLPYKEHLRRGEDGYEIDPASGARFVCEANTDNDPRSSCSYRYRGRSEPLLTVQSSD